MLDTATTPPYDAADDAPAFTVTVHGSRMPFGIDDDAFARWVAAEGDELECNHPDPDDASPGSAVSDLVYRALSAGVLVGDPAIELNVHSHADGAGYFVRLNNHSGHQQLVGLTRGRHELNWPPNDLTTSEITRHYLQQICDIANTLLDSLLAAAI
jgi:hypothetical protein